MWRLLLTRSVRPPGTPAPPTPLRDRLAMQLGIATVVCLTLFFFFAKNTQFLMPGPLSSAHGAIEDCGTCHTGSGSGQLGWAYGLVAGDRHADSTACLTCHKMPDTALNAHGARADVLKQSTERLMKIAAKTPAPLSARAQNAAFPTDGMAERGVNCATCHQEHKGANFDLSKLSNEQCRSCHVVKFDSFDGDHPKFENYPFKRRTGVIYDHASHFGKHFPEVAKKDPAKRIPETCSTCHNSRDDKRVMAVAPFEQTCASCHLDQITGKERASGPKGIAFLSLPGLDLKTLEKKRAAIGEWPDASEAELTPFMKIMIGRNDRGRALLKSVDRLNLQDLSRANDAQIKAVTNLVWEIKRIYYALITGKASDVLGDLGVGGGARPSASLVADLTASMPRDVVIGAQQQWLPDLGREMASRKDVKDTREVVQSGGWITTVAETRSVDDDEAPAAAETARSARSDRQTGESAASAAKPAVAEPEVAKAEPASAKPDNSKAADARPPPKAADQTDDLLSPTPEELRAMATPVKEASPPSPPLGNRNASAEAPVTASASPPAQTPAGSDAAPARPQARPAPVISIESSVDPENWAEYGGWYRQDYAIFYRPAGHKDKFIYSWLFLTGPQAPKGSKSPAGTIFDALTHKDAQGSCTKCHSVDDIPRKGRVVNFSPASLENKKGRFTQFIHEPHFGILEKRGCASCHELAKDRPYLKSYEQGNPKSFASNFGAVNKDLCQTCHTSNMARQDCLTCHKYHVNDVITPIMSTKIPTE